MMGCRYIELFPSSPLDMALADEEKKSNPALADAPQSRVLRMRGLPFEAGAEDICAFFKGYMIAAILPKVISPKDNRPTGEAYVEFMFMDDCLKAFKEKQHSSMERRYVELYPSSQEEMTRSSEESR